MTEFEKIPDEEAEQIANIVRLTREHFDQRYPGSTPVRRGVHPKDHGCVKATFTVLDPLAEEFRVGVFAKPGQQFNALIRFSNADIDAQKPDSSIDTTSGKDVVRHGSRGMAVKLFGVSGNSLMRTRGPLTQDFLMINQPVFAFANVEDYEALSKVNDDPVAFLKERLSNPDKNVRDRAARTREIISGITTSVSPFPFQPPPISPVDNQYFSGAPFLFGSDRVMKYSAKPRSPEAGDLKDVTDKDYLRTALYRRLMGRDARTIEFDFQIQVRDAQTIGDIETQIENVCTLWPDRFETVATISIAPQNFESAEQKALCEDLIFSPWNGLVEHRPLGGINRLRRDVYLASSQIRHEQPTPTSRRCPYIE